MDEQTMKKWRKGLVFFCVFAGLIFLMTTMPDGVSLLLGFLGLFGISGVIVRDGGTTYVVNIIVILGVVFCGLVTWNIWYGYRRQFGEMKWYLYRAPVFIAIFLLLFSGTIFQPSPIDRMFFAAMARREGVSAISVKDGGTVLRYAQNEDGVWVYEYNMLLHHHSDGFASFYVKFRYAFWDMRGVVENSEIWVICPDGEPISFSVHGSGTFTLEGEIVQDRDTLGVTQVFHAVYVILVDKCGNQHIPRHLVRFR